MSVSLVQFVPGDPADREAFVDFMATNEFPYHVTSKPSRELIERRIAEGAYEDHDHRAYWLEERWKGRIGVVIFEDLSDNAPLFDIRLSEAVRGQGLGIEALRAIAKHVFETMPDVNRLEGQTREDNVPMRRIFRNASWVQEAYYREAWPTEGDVPPLGSVAYSLLRHDWEHGTVTPVRWDAQ